MNPKNIAAIVGGAAVALAVAIAPLAQAHDSGDGNPYSAIPGAAQRPKVSAPPEMTTGSTSTVKPAATTLNAPSVSPTAKATPPVDYCTNVTCSNL
jgi:hypothetical protein